MDIDDLDWNAEPVEAGHALDDADPREVALTRAVLQALRSWMLDGRTVVITHDTTTHEVRIEAGDGRDPVLATDRFSWPDAVDVEPRCDCRTPRRCPGPAPAAPTSGRRSGRRRR